MFCQNCGAEVNEQSNFCLKCGAKIDPPKTTVQNNDSQPNPYIDVPFVEEPQNQVNNQNPQQPQNQQFNEAQNQNYRNYVNQSQPIQTQPSTQLPMGWFKFIVNFQLFFAAVINFVFGANFVMGSVYSTQGIDSEQVYGTFGTGLRIVDILYGLLSIALGVFCIIIRNKLAKFKKDSPKQYILLNIISFAIEILYSVLAVIVIAKHPYFDIGSAGQVVFSSQLLFQFGANISMIIINIIYFKKREFMFIND